MENKWLNKWNEDIDYLKENLINNHKNLFFYISMEEFNKKIEKLRAMINELDYNDMKVELSRVVSSIKDAHTSIIFPINKYIPIKFYWFNDGIYIINTSEKYRDLMYKKVLAIGDVDIEEVLKELSYIISFENEYFFKAQSMKYIQSTEVLYGLLIIDSIDSIKLRTEDEEVEVEAVSSNGLVYINRNLPLYARRSSENFWYKHIKERNEIYIKYNYCREDSDDKLSEKIKSAIKCIEENKIYKVTIDLRNNLGGDSTLIEPLLDYIKGNDKINTKENLRVVIGRETFSSGLLNAYEFKFKTNSTIIGEPSGGKPNCYGEVLRFTLPNSKFIVSYSTKYYRLIDDDNLMTLYPDEYVYESIEDYY